jgi:hypothetical protein
MKNLKTTILTAFIAICCLTNGIAQENARKNRGKVMLPGSPGSIVVFGGGTSMPSSDGKDKAFLSNSTAINADAFFSLISKPEANFSFGLNFGGTYYFGGSGGFGVTPNPFAVTGQASSLVSDRGVDPKSPGFRMGAGPQANFYFGKFVVSPMVLGEYFSMTQKEMSIVQTTQFNGQSYDFNLATLPETKTSGFAVTPKLRLHYMFNNRFGLFADVSYTTGPKMETTVSKLIPNGNPQTPGDTYNLQQLQTGTMVKGETKSTAYSAMGFNFGVVIGLGGNAHGDNLTNGIVKPACTCCGSKFHATGECPKYPNCHNVNASASAQVPNSEMIKEEDIKKGWNGTLKGLFEIENSNIVLSKNGGVEKLINQINKEGKGKASLVKIRDKDYIKVESTFEKESINSYYELSNTDNNPLGIIIGAGGVVCKTGGCGDCNLRPWYSGSEKCFCDSDTNPTSFHSCSLYGMVKPITDYLNINVTSFPATIDDKGNLTATSIKEIEKILSSELPNIKLEKTDLIKDNNQWYLISQINDGDNKSLIIKKADMVSKRTIHIGIMSIQMYCGGGNCGTGSQSCYSISPIFATYFICPCVTHNCLPQFGILNGWQTK